MAKRRKSDGKGNHEIDLLVWMLKFASLISRPMRDGVADPAGLSANELRLLMALSGEGESAGHTPRPTAISTVPGERADG